LEILKKKKKKKSNFPPKKMSSTIVKKALEVCTTRFDQSLEEPEQQQTQVNNVKKIKNQGSFF